MAEHLSEDLVIDKTLGFLKSYYKTRPRAMGEVKVERDLRPDGKFIIDGRVSYNREDGSAFFATLEATSQAKKAEVVFTTARGLLFWDAFAVASSVVAIFFCYAYIKDIFTVTQWGVEVVSIALIFSQFLLTIFYFIFFSRTSRYRNIYAIEQFKRYYADEQWVSMAYDVLDNFPDRFQERYMQELKRQCVKNGIGLILVDEKGKATIFVSPARRILLANRHRITEFITQNELVKRLSMIQEMRWWKRLRERRVAKLYSQTASQVRSFRKRYSYQVVVAILALAAMSIIFYLEWRDRQIHFLSESEFAEQMEQKMKGSFKETSNYFTEADLNKVEKKGISEKPIVITEKYKKDVTYDCSRFHVFIDPVFIVQDSSFGTYRSAKKYIDDLVTYNNIETTCIWMGCFPDIDTSFVVYYGALHSTRDSAYQTAEAYRKVLGEDYAKHHVRVRALVPKYYLNDRRLK